MRRRRRRRRCCLPVHKEAPHIVPPSACLFPGNLLSSRFRFCILVCSCLFITRQSNWIFARCLPYSNLAVWGYVAPLVADGDDYHNLPVCNERENGRLLRFCLSHNQNPDNRKDVPGRPEIRQIGTGSGFGVYFDGTLLLPQYLRIAEEPAGDGWRRDGYWLGCFCFRRADPFW